MKRWIPWAAALLVVLALAAAAFNVLSARKAKAQALLAASSAPAAAQVELAGTDVVKAQVRELAQGLAISGSLRAVNSAVVKARVAGELQGLSVREGDTVRAGQVIARIASNDYDARVRQAREQAASAKAQADVAQRQYDNNRALVKQGFISTTALDTSQSNLNAANATYRAALAGADVAARSVADTVLTSPISGQISQRLAQPGERVAIDSKIVEVVDVSRLELEASLGAQESLSVRVGQTAQLQIEGSAQTLRATVARINPSAQAGSRSVLAYLSLENPAGASLRQGLFAQGTLGTAQASLLALPLGSVRTDKPAPYVQAIENGQVVHKSVALGARGTAGGETLVAVTGLSEGTLVIAGHIGALSEGTQVRFTPMAGAPAPSSPAASATATSAASATSAP
ncbi:MAG: efflux RND transporter periplasmic adaptor subunit [Pseudomonadota bacterium]|nr:efflux RND transporter periplasmic adaptor subunit [Pseudomonadota bacterium]